MNFYHHLPVIALVTTLGVLLSGCQLSDDPLAIESVAEVVTAPTSEKSPTPPAEPLAESTPPDNVAVASVAADWKAPFPDRVDLFQAPRHQSKGVVRSDEQDSDAVDLLGFVNVHSPRVVIMVDGQVAPVAQGDQHMGVEVISIHPPTVVLQRGRQRWQASLTP